jgi:hypothetical protein
MQQPAAPTNLTLDDVKLHFDHWRATRAKRGKIPDSLWNEVKTLIGRYPTNKIAQTLGVNAYQISTGVNNKIDFTFVATRPAALPLPANKPVSSSSINAKDTCSLEIHRHSGGMLKINEFPLTSLFTIINQFME